MLHEMQMPVNPVNQMHSGTDGHQRISPNTNHGGTISARVPLTPTTTVVRSAVTRRSAISVCYKSRLQTLLHGIPGLMTILETDEVQSTSCVNTSLMLLECRMISQTASPDLTRHVATCSS